jgi:sulfite reductase (ferredoxin)
MPDATPPPQAFTLKTATLEQLSKAESLKARSEGLFYVAGKERHTFRSEIEAMGRGESETLSNEAKELSKHFGIYKQQARGERGRKNGDLIFMVRIKNPGGGELSSRAWKAVDEGAEAYADGTLRLTTRQGVQFHHVAGRKLGAFIRHLNRGYREGATLGACGDVNRNVMCCPVDGLDREASHGAHALAHAIAEELAPRSSAYFQIFLTDEEGQTEIPLNSDEPLYGPNYLPRKFKIAIGPPGENCVDLLTNDIGLVPVLDAREGKWYDLYTGGGLGITHNMPRTRQLLALFMGRIPGDRVVETAKAIALLQKENGERKDRRQARWKYTLRRLGPEAVLRELRERFGIRVEPCEPQPLRPLSLHLGWHAQRSPGLLYRGISVENGRLRDTDGAWTRSAVRRVVEEFDLGVRITPQQDLLLCNVPEKRRQAVDRILADHGVRDAEALSVVRRSAMACPAKPTCGLAMTEAERALPGYIDALERAGLGDVDLHIRMSGCPNGCSRPGSAELGIFGYGKNDYVIQVGGSRAGTRIGKVLYPRVPEEKMITVLTGIFRAVKEHAGARSAGDFLAQTSPKQLRAWVAWNDLESGPDPIFPSPIPASVDFLQQDV